MGTPNKRIKPRPVDVYWLDAACASAWSDIGTALDRQPLECITSGTILHRDKQRVIVAQTCSISNGYIESVTDVMTIPAPCVTRVRRHRKGT